MDLSNDESNFGYGEINETIPVDSHVQEDFMTEDYGMYFSSFSDLKSDIIMIENLEDLKDPLLWETFDKDVGDFTVKDMKENGSRKSRIDRHPTSRIYKCSAEGLREQKHIDNPDRVRKPKPLTRCLREVEMHFKWIRDLDCWIVTKFETKHTHLLAKSSDALYIRYGNLGMRSTQRCESMYRTIKTSIDPSMKLYRLVQLYDQVMEELRVQDGHNDYMIVHTYLVIEGVFHIIKAYAAKICTRNCYELLCKEMTFESMYVMKGEKQKSGGPEKPIYYWLQDAE
ncbi:hypothetical protein Cgig2_015774 [Carnegiea gigantea]|uniref:Protein FAR1-RELATED SEQUENCE n=1 Tax=Carnegiea gigantea TaxID=171969 RepID=A0A9Q1QJ05_9CARY|nr:hypothetical protein Cgig2_015774 [Carnegiea gigantea]